MSLFLNILLWLDVCDREYDGGCGRDDPAQRLAGHHAPGVHRREATGDAEQGALCV